MLYSDKLDLRAKNLLLNVCADNFLISDARIKIETDLETRMNMLKLHLNRFFKFVLEV